MYPALLKDNFHCIENNKVEKAVKFVFKMKMNDIFHIPVPQSSKNHTGIIPYIIGELGLYSVLKCFRINSQFHTFH